ncbi:hypothetical protein NUW58_g239 [Xylaria curta]|uniref:Uncharacterized protein n=1 Tax=Xylaria curta TaxID=42375 RepID=A0ACC1PPY1_9PEZI|nr:hypothetical protein NUW58_g239 [Xylaria curta]
MDSSHSSPGGLTPYQLWMAERLKVNQENLGHYAISLASLIAVFIVGHWIRRLSWKLSRTVFLRPLAALSRIVRKGSLRTLPGFTSVGHAVLVSVFVGLNALFTFYRLDYSKLGNLAARCGWMATGNLAFVVFLALKNTPLALLTAYSYERLNVLHQIAGYTTLVHTILHSVLYTYYFIHDNRISVLQAENITAGIVLSFAMLFTVVAGMTLRKFKYELFYIVHLILFVVIVVTLGLHQPSFDKKKILVVTVLIASSWFIDRLIRATRLAYNGINNKAEVSALPNGGTRIVLRKPLQRARPGKHCYVWLPHIRKFETHPFTIVATEPLELVVNKYSGFTEDLHQFAIENPGASLTVSVEGPYGTLPDPMDFDKVVLVAGGAGATFTMGLARDMMQRMGPNSTKEIDLIWATRERENVSWFAQHLTHFSTHEYASKIALKLHITKAGMNPTSIASSPSQTSTAETSRPASILEKNTESPALSTKASTILPREKDIEKNDVANSVDYTEEIPSTIAGLNLPVIYSRPNLEDLVSEAILSLDKDKKILIAACGPDRLVSVVRNATASCIPVDGPSVELHCEQFGW